MGDLSEYRREIDEIDKELTKLFEKRMNTVLKVAKYKKENNLNVLQQGREEEVLNKAIENLDDKGYSNEIVRFLNYTMEISRDLQNKKIGLSEVIQPMNIAISEIDKYAKVGFPGVEGAFTEEALIKFFGNDCSKVAYEEFEDVFEALNNKEIDYGILPIENSSTGAVSITYDLLKKYGFYIVGEECIRIEQHLVGIHGSIVEEIDEVYSHHQGIEQSSEFLKKYPHLKLIPFHNTAISAKLIKELCDKSKAAIASRRAAEIYGLDIIKECINNQKDNFTRFIVISRKFTAVNDSDKVSVVFSLEDKAGTLYRLLRYFAENHLNMIKIESRPMKNSSWKYLLYVDFEGDIASKEVANALNLIDKNSQYFKLLGAYKRNVN